MATEPIKYTELTFQQIVESFPNAIILLNQEGVITMANKQAEILFGYLQNEMIGNNPLMFIPGWFGGSCSDLFAQQKNGTEVQVEINVNSIETADGLMVVVSIIDITLRKQGELESRRELEQFAYMASHDLQEPLRTVSNYMQVIEEDYVNRVLDEEALKYIHAVNNAINRMKMLIKELLDR